MAVVAWGLWGGTLFSPQISVKKSQGPLKFFGVLCIKNWHIQREDISTDKHLQSYLNYKQEIHFSQSERFHFQNFPEEHAPETPRKSKKKFLASGWLQTF